MPNPALAGKSKFAAIKPPASKVNVLLTSLSIRGRIDLRAATPVCDQRLAQGRHFAGFDIWETDTAVQAVNRVRRCPEDKSADRGRAAFLGIRAGAVLGTTSRFYRFVACYAPCKQVTAQYTCLQE